MATGFMKLVCDSVTYASRVHPAVLQGPERSDSSWSPPPLGMIKVNTDASVNQEGYVVISCVIRDDDGQLAMVGGKKIWARWKPELAEAMGMRF